MPRPQPLVHQGVRCSSGRSRETIVLRDRFSLVQISYRSICHNCCSSNLSKRNKKPNKEGFVFCAGMKVDRSTPITIYSTGKDVSAFFRHLVHFCKPKRRSSLRCRSSSPPLFYSLSLFLSLSPFPAAVAPPGQALANRRAGRSGGSSGSQPTTWGPEVARQSEGKRTAGAAPGLCVVKRAHPLPFTLTGVVTEDEFTPQSTSEKPLPTLVQPYFQFCRLREEETKRHRGESAHKP